MRVVDRQSVCQGRKEQISNSGTSTQENILGTARQLFARDGYEATSTEKVLQQTGISRGALYHHFRNKEALFEAVLEQVEKELVGVALEAAAQAANPVAALRAGCASFLMKSTEPEVRQIVLVDAQSVLGWRKWREIEERYGLGLLKQGFRNLAAAGHIRESESDLYAHILLAIMIEIAFLSARSSNPSEAAQGAMRTVDDLIERLISTEHGQASG